MDDTLDRLRTARVIPVATIADPDAAVPLASALVRGGLPVIEITLRTPAGLDALRRVAASVPGALVGAGTVTTAAACEAAIEGGARFVVSPGLVEQVIDVCRRRGVLALPGIATPTELLRALALGCETVKLFPASLMGGPAMVKALDALGTGACFVPTGGVSLATAGDYLAMRSVVAVGGSWMVPSDLVAAGDWPAIETLATEASSVLQGPDRERS